MYIPVPPPSSHICVCFIRSLVDILYVKAVLQTHNPNSLVCSLAANSVHPVLTALTNCWILSPAVMSHLRLAMLVLHYWTCLWWLLGWGMAGRGGVALRKAEPLLAGSSVDVGSAGGQPVWPDGYKLVTCTIFTIADRHLEVQMQILQGVGVIGNLFLLKQPTAWSDLTSDLSWLSYAWPYFGMLRRGDFSV